MLNIQNALKNNVSLDDFGISKNTHLALPVSIYNYSQIESDKTHPIVQEARGLILDNEHNLIGKSFNRFFNLGEVPQLHEQFNWANFTCQSKEDGSLIIICKYQDHILVNTRNSFGEGIVNGSQYTWRDLVIQGLENTNLSALFDIKDAPQSYVFELTTPYNQVVRYYEKPSLYLLSAFKGIDELSHIECDELANRFSLNRPTLYNFKSLDNIQEFLKEQELKDPTFEGVICRDSNNMRLKIKSLSYLRLHRTINNGNLFLNKNLVPVVMNNEIDEILCYFPHLEKQVQEVRQLLNIEFDKLNEVWQHSSKIEQQKDFAIYVLDRAKFPAILFTARKTQKELSEVWRESADLIVKTLF